MRKKAVVNELEKKHRQSPARSTVAKSNPATAWAGSLQGKRVLITGAGRGIGKGLAQHLAACGARVCVNVMSSADIDQEFIRNLDSGPGSNSFAFAADIRDTKQIAKLFKEIAKRWNGLDILINNAGVESIVSALDIEPAEWDRIQDTNLRGAFFCAQSAARIMKQGSGGVILNISSIHDAVPRLGTAHYCASKAGLSMLTKSLALEWAEYGIRVVGLAPGAIETDINREVLNKFGRSRFKKWIPAKRLGNVSDVANAVCFLASDAASYLTGATLNLDGGYSVATVQYDPRRE